MSRPSASSSSSTSSSSSVPTLRKKRPVSSPMPWFDMYLNAKEQVKKRKLAVDELHGAKKAEQSKNRPRRAALDDAESHLDFLLKELKNVKSIQVFCQDEMDEIKQLKELGWRGKVSVFPPPHVNESEKAAIKELARQIGIDFVG